MSLKTILASLATCIVLSGCGTTTPAAAPATPAKLSVVASFYPLAFLAESIGGSNVQVTTIIPAGAEPHDYEPTPKEIASIYKAAVFIHHGAGIDPWAMRIAPDLAAKGVKIMAATAGMTLLPGAHEEEEGAHTETETALLDPHVWSDPVLLVQIAERIRDTLIAADPAHAAAYTANTTALRTSLTLLDTEFRTTLGTACRLHEVIVSHNAFAYLGARYGITMLPIAGISPEAEPSPIRMAELTKLATTKGIKYVTFETLVSPKVAETIAQEIGAKTLVLNPVEGLTDAQVQSGANLLTIMRENLHNLATAMECPTK